MVLRHAHCDAAHVRDGLAGMLAILTIVLTGWRRTLSILDMLTILYTLSTLSMLSILTLLLVFLLY